MPRRSSNTPRERRGLVARHLRQVPQHVADRHQTVLDVVVDLSRQVARRDAALGLAQPGGAEAEPLGHGAERGGERADLVVASVAKSWSRRSRSIAAVFSARSASGRLDSRREPARRREECEASGRRGREETPRCDALPE